jgi:hypothetical protein
LGTTVKDLKAFKESNAAAPTDESDPAAMDLPMATAEGVEPDPFANDSGTEPWWDRDNWDLSEREKVEALEAESTELSTKSSAASTAVFDAETEVMLRVRERYLAKGWKPAKSSE